MGELIVNLYSKDSGISYPIW